MWGGIRIAGAKGKKNECFRRGKGQEHPPPVFGDCERNAPGAGPISYPPPMIGDYPGALTGR
jgi:hypothetical protein